MPIIKRHQTTADVAVQYGGHIEGWWEVITGLGVGFTDDVAPGTNFGITVLNSRVAKAIADNGVDVITNLVFNGFERLGGIGYMQIENDFKITPP